MGASTLGFGGRGRLAAFLVVLSAVLSVAFSGLIPGRTQE